MKTFIVTGANGFVGSALVRKLITNNISVIAISNSFDNCRLPDSPLITYVQSDIHDISKLSEKLAGQEYDCFYNLAWRGVNGAEKSMYSIQIDNIALSLKCAELAKNLGCKKYLCAGTIAERAVESLSLLSRTSNGMMYGSAKYCNRVLLETYCKNVRLDFVWMQFSNIYGPSNKTGNLISYTLNQLANDLPAIFGPAEQAYDFVYVDDLIEAVYRLGIYKTNSNFYFIGSGTPRKLSEYLITIGKLAKKEHLIQIGVREDDGIKYSIDMMDINDLVADVGNYVSASFEDHMTYTMQNF